MNAWALVPDHLLLALGWTLAHFLWQGALIAFLFAIATRAFDRHASGPRYALASGALALMAIVPVATFAQLAGEFQARSAAATVTPELVPGDSKPAVVVSLPPRGAASTPAPGRAAYEDAQQSRSVVGHAVKPVQPPASAAADLEIVRAAYHHETPAPPPARGSFLDAARLTGVTALRLLVGMTAGAVERGAALWVPWFVALWGMGVSVLMLRLIGGWVIAQRIKRTVIDAPVDRLQAAVDRLSARLSVSRPVRVFRSALVEVPTVIGWLRPVVLVPVGAVSGLTPAQLEALLAHELAHIRRHDYLVNLLQTVVETLLFYHPAVWWVSARVREERENCCDDLAVAACGDRVAYARALCELERLRAPAPALALAASGGSLLQRIRRLLQPAPRVSLVSRCGACLTVIGALAVVTLGLAPAAAVGRGGAEGVLAALAAFAPEPPAPPDVSRAPDPVAPAPPAPPAAPGDAWAPPAPVSPAPAVAPVPGVAPAPGVAPLPGVAPAPAPAAPDAPGLLPAPAGAPVPAVPGAMALSLVADWARELTREVERDTRRAVQHMVRKDLSISVTPVIQAVAAGIPRAAGAAWERVAEARAVAEATAMEIDEKALERLIVHGVDAKFVHEMTAALGEMPDVEELVALRASGVTPEYARTMTHAFGETVDVGELIALRAHGIQPDFAHRMRGLLSDRPDADDLVALRVHGVDADYAREIATRMGGQVDAEDLVNMRIQDVAPWQLDALQRIGVDPGEEGLVELRSHGISLGYVTQMRHFRGHDLTLDQVIALHERGISPEMVGAMNVLGYRSLSVDDLVSLAENGWSVESIAQFTSTFGRALTMDELAALQNEGVSVVYAGNMAHLGGAEFSVGDIVRFHQHGASSAWVSAVLASGYAHTAVDDLIMLADHGVESRHLAGLVRAGYGSLDPAEVAQLADHGVGLDCIERVRAAGGDRLSAGEIIARCTGNEQAECQEKTPKAQKKRGK